jgi:hypothetical protein
MRATREEISTSLLTRISICDGSSARTSNPHQNSKQKDNDTARARPLVLVPYVSRPLIQSFPYLSLRPKLHRVPLRHLLECRIP